MIILGNEYKTPTTDGGKTPPVKNLKEVPRLIKKTDAYKTVKYLVDNGLRSTTAHLSVIFLAVVAILTYRYKRKKK